MWRRKHTCIEKSLYQGHFKVPSVESVCEFLEVKLLMFLTSVVCSVDKFLAVPYQDVEPFECYMCLFVFG
ncbi:hypothetical protein AXFE_03160 [Acidithrix ferrooxidans]|uniref:Uncharacterized protein n=1 Tax=Acidithrix ferrooxidans TaxID=1280514 RepID=A0A0D8HH39_9ACTN|nr:hypothetical protein AXFE_35510 [Acidithrix ferrooxidans]KJF17309.1 hypothetical protein AXFE_18200 [Acidithrix ferrooxidans]KJF17315.1 hypothetical protein AXFE_18260 [Acidithrix ferrooxidans]KJF17772.1 hypothetical protein AXFE_12690 [Acidithrix ferrooxidans]KJF18820.1 hypothetical protein AXFE_03160 [Acidithrix ferrooxidans]